MKLLCNCVALGLTGIAISLSGCGNGPATDGSGSPPPSETANSHDLHDHSGHDHGEHAHPSEGPHHGELIELGNEEYHAELVHNDQSVTIYILDSGATTPVPIEATEIKINARHDGEPEQYSLPASPDENDPEGRSSRFVSEDTDLVQHLDEAGFEPKLQLTIQGKSYQGEFSHRHDHEHDHEH
ncbi:MAG: hypothetical protein KDA93_09965 [Planctomycetaceae bacterium]|nr:hypothetical protein [Planctomycetaceae bacterium]